MKKIVLFLFVVFLMTSCASYRKNSVSCPVDNSFNIKMKTDNFTRNQEKDFANYIINNSSLKYDASSDYLINLNATITKSGSLISENNTVSRINVNLIVRYELVDVKTKKILDSKKFVSVESVNISEFLYSNRIDEMAGIENLSKNISLKLENRIKTICNLN